MSYWLALILLGVPFFSVQAKSEKKDYDPLEVLHADSMEYIGGGDKTWIRFIGNVEIKHGNLKIQSQKADYFKKEQKADLSENVKVFMPDTKMRADRVIYDAKSQEINAKGNLYLEDLDDEISLQGEWGKYFRKGEIAKVYGRPILTRVDTAKNDTFTITSDSMEYVEQERKFTAFGNAIVNAGNIRTNSQKVEFFSDSNKVYLTGDPKFYLEKNEMSGEIIELHLKNEQVDNIFVCRNAQGKYFELDSLSDRERISEIFGDTIHLVMHEDLIQKIFVNHKARSYYYFPDEKESADETAGQFIRMEFEEKSVREVVINGNATSMYHNRENDKITGRNDASGDTIYVYFDNNQVSTVSVRGGARGTYLLME